MTFYYRVGVHQKDSTEAAEKMTNLAVVHDGHHHSGVVHSFHGGHHAKLHVGVALPLPDAKACVEDRKPLTSGETVSASLLSNLC